ncbi:cyclophane-forming radical SAM/SPASM peptide maturase GrrM/OscB [Rhizobium leguminosarum]|uniref:cyclophane-forming radical SAM/SPASM peptide maturase GrrM/OscB n=1 Tax=Rhizobium TaxID=379 RepID=UPI00140FB8BC|nr:cyclophane-forming radical SAM/SPASM peptide maturase GrrM/OscB [Rhizobium leguminosarum]MBY5917732.1 GRRM system radical SAM/SPASM domain protein [Rhizobium leguminosarum]QIO66042.1 GRRM system radical SAM/SPASM domain protein [Rhizobium leguminosarum bv. trifolii]
MEEFLTAADLRGTTRLLIMQPTAFCNIDCLYCYLPNRNDRKIMSIETARQAAAFVFESAIAAVDLTVVWHAGEPLVVPPDWYRKAIAAMQTAAPVDVRPVHAIQTNGMLIDDRWCHFFLEVGMQVGVSIDGPARLHDARRRTRSGGGTHATTMRGVERLQRHGVPFHVICVVGRDTLDAADELMDFFAAEGITRIGFNIEEIEGPTRHSTLEAPGTIDGYRRFLERVLQRSDSYNPPIAIRERDEILALLKSPLFGRFRGNSQNVPLGIVTVAADGALFTFSPELAGLKEPRFDDFVIGRLPDATVESVLASPNFQAMWAEIEAGTNRCKRTCAYFDLCLGGAPSNKLSENGTFDSTETMFCRHAHMAVADTVLADLEAQIANCPARVT